MYILMNQLKISLSILGVSSRKTNRIHEHFFKGKSYFRRDVHYKGFFGGVGGGHDGGGPIFKLIPLPLLSLCIVANI